MCKNAGKVQSLQNAHALEQCKRALHIKCTQQSIGIFLGLIFFALATTGKIFSAKRGDWKVHEIAHYCDHMTLGDMIGSFQIFFHY